MYTHADGEQMVGSGSAMKLQWSCTGEAALAHANSAMYEGARRMLVGGDGRVVMRRAVGEHGVRRGVV